MVLFEYVELVAFCALCVCRTMRQVVLCLQTVRGILLTVSMLRELLSHRLVFLALPDTRPFHLPMQVGCTVEYYAVSDSVDTMSQELLLGLTLPVSKVLVSPGVLMCFLETDSTHIALPMQVDGGVD